MSDKPRSFGQENATNKVADIRIEEAVVVRDFGLGLFRAITCCGNFQMTIDIPEDVSEISGITRTAESRTVVHRDQLTKTAFLLHHGQTVIVVVQRPPILQYRHLLCHHPHHLA